MDDINRKVFILGIDGGTWRVLDPLIKMGEMPFLKSFSENAWVGDLESTIPPMTGCAWTSFQTGMEPGGHGIFHFIQFDRASSRLKFVNASAIKADTIWGIASAAGKKVLAVNVPMTYPPVPVNGVMISGIPVPEAGPDIMYPSDLHEELSRNVGEYKTVVHHHVYYSNGLEHFINELVDTIERRRDVALYLLRRHEWDLAMVHFQSVDVLQHVLWNTLMGEKGVTERDRSAVIRFYRKLDEIIGEILAETESSGLRLVMSDHGFGGDQKVVYINKWLAGKGLMVERGRFRARRALSHVVNILRKIDKRRLRTRLVKAEKRRNLLLKENNDTIDWERTRAFAATVGPYALVYIEPVHGSAKDKNDLRKEIVEGLRQIVDPETGKTVVEEILSKEMVYKGAYTEEAPDLICVAREGYAFDFHGSGFGKSLVQRIDALRHPPGSHRLEGILALAGEDVNSSATLRNPKISDLAPTILFALGLPVDDAMDGRVLTEAFTERFLKGTPLVLENSQGREPGHREYRFSESEEEAVERSLRGLGYF